MPSLPNLPAEIRLMIAESLDLVDRWNLALTCRAFDLLRSHETYSKETLTSEAPFSREALGVTPRTHAKTLRRLHKRCEALSTASPYIVAQLGIADDFLYCNGYLCSTNDRLLRILNLHKPDGTELVIDVRQLIGTAIDSADSKRSQFYTFKPLHLAHDILSSLYTHSFGGMQRYWLVVINIQTGQVLRSHSLRSALKVFVRNDAEFLVCGTQSGTSYDRHRRWLLNVHNLKTKDYYDGVLENFAGSDVGSTISFEIFDGFLHGVSTQSSFEVQEIDWNSYYTAFRFRLSDEKFEDLRWAIKKMWRREHREGTLDDRWTFLKLFRDEASGVLRVSELRKEHGAGGKRWQRTYYTDDLIDFETKTVPVASMNANNPAIGISHRSKRTTQTAPEFHDPSRILEDADEDFSMLSHKRQARDVHPGDDASTEPGFTFSQSYIRSYHPLCQTWLDLVDDAEDTYDAVHCIRLRAGSRRLRPLQNSTPKSMEPAASGDDPIEETREEVARLYSNSDLTLWPPKTSAYQPVRDILSPARYQGAVTTAWDDRSLVYGIRNDHKYTFAPASEQGDKVKMAIIFVCFDPAIHLEGIPRFTIGQPSAEAREMTAKTASNANAGGNLEQPTQPGCNWLRREPACYLMSARGFYFGLDKAKPLSQ
jgi:hypothetical protein